MGSTPPENKSNLPISVAMHYKEKKADLAANDSITKTDTRKMVLYEKTVPITEEKDHNTINAGSNIVVQKTKRGRKPKNKMFVANPVAENNEKEGYKKSSKEALPELQLCCNLPTPVGGTRLSFPHACCQVDVLPLQLLAPFASG